MEAEQLPTPPRWIERARCGNAFTTEDDRFITETVQLECSRQQQLTAESIAVKLYERVRAAFAEICPSDLSCDCRRLIRLMKPLPLRLSIILLSNGPIDAGKCHPLSK